MINKEKQIKNSLIYLSPVIISSLLPFITLPVFTRFLTIEDFGILALAQVCSLFITGIANFGMIIGYERNFFEYDKNDAQSQLLYSVLVFVLTWLLLFGFITFFLKDFLSQWFIGSSEYGDLMFLSYIASAINLFKPYFLIYFKNIEDAKSNAMYIICDVVILNLLSIIFVVYYSTGISGILWGQIISGSLILCSMTIYFLRRFKFSLNWSILKNCLLVSYPLTPRIFLKIIGTQFDKYLIGLMNTVGGVGIYHIGQKISSLVFAYMTTLDNVFMPQVYQRMFELREGGGKSIGKYLTPFVYMSIAAALAVSLFAEEIVKIATPSSYHSATDIIIILSLYYGTMFFGKQPQLIYKKKTHISTLLFMVYLVLNVVLNIPFIKFWGVQGAAWATFTSGIIYVIMSFSVSQHYYKIEWEYWIIIKIYTIFFVSSILMILFKYYSVNYYLSLLFKILILFIYMNLGIKINIVTIKNFLIVKNIIFRKATNYTNDS